MVSSILSSEVGYKRNERKYHEGIVYLYPFVRITFKKREILEEWNCSSSFDRWENEAETMELLAVYDEIFRGVSQDRKGCSTFPWRGRLGHTPRDLSRQLLWG